MDFVFLPKKHVILSQKMPRDLNFSFAHRFNLFQIKHIFKSKKLWSLLILNFPTEKKKVLTQLPKFFSLQK